MEPRCRRWRGGRSAEEAAKQVSEQGLEDGVYGVIWFALVDREVMTRLRVVMWVCLTFVRCMQLAIYILFLG